MKTFYQLVNGQMIITFADLEGDYPFLQRSLRLYKQTYQKAYPERTLAANDFKVVASEDGKRYIKYPENVVCINIGDLTDKTRSNTGRKECYNLSLVEIFSNTHNLYGERMISILGNRETTKFRLQKELNPQFILKVLHDELSLNEEERAKKGPARDPKLVWVDGTAQTFLSYLKSLPQYSSSSDAELTAALNTLGEQQLKILYAKWMLANSCGAPSLWEDIATEAESENDEKTLLILEHNFCNEQSPYANYLRHCQLGVQVGNTLFTHGGLEDNSFILPKSLEKILTKEQIKEVFGEGAIVAKNNNQLLLALNLWYARLVELHFHNPEHLDTEEAFSELINMGLPRQRHKGSSLINVAFTDANGAYGNPITDENREKLIQSGTLEPIHFIYHGHMPAERPRIGTLMNTVQDQDIMLHHIGGDTCNYRKKKAAVATTFRKENHLTFVQIEQIDETSLETYHQVALLGKNKQGQLVDAHGQLADESNPKFFLGYPVMFDGCDEDKQKAKGWNIVDYNQEEDEFILFKQNGLPSFAPETRTASSSEIYRLLDVTDKVHHAKILAKKMQLFKQKKEEVLESVDRILSNLLAKSEKINYVFPETRSEMTRLLSSLCNAQDEYKEHLRTGMNDDEMIGAVKAGSLFIGKCRAAINESLDVLDRDLGWGDDLLNCMKNIMNAVIRIASFGRVNNFFTPIISEPTRLVSDAQRDLTCVFH